MLIYVDNMFPPIRFKVLYCIQSSVCVLVSVYVLIFL